VGDTLTIPSSLSMSMGSRPTQSPNGKLLVSAVDREHPLYEANKLLWGHLSLLYEGGDIIKRSAGEFLIRRPKEDGEVWNTRLSMFTYQNLLRNGIGWYKSRMFKEDPSFTYDTSIDQYYRTDFMQDANGAKMSFVEVFRQTFTKCAVLGKSFVLVDLPSPSSDEIPASLADQREKGLLNPRLAVYSPLSAINWDYDRRGDLNWIIFKETDYVSSFAAQPRIRDRWYYFDRVNYTVYEVERDATQTVASRDVEVTEVDSGPHALAAHNIVPVVCIDFEDSLWLGKSVYLPILAHLNQDNSLAWALFMSNLAMPVIISDGDISDSNREEGGYYQLPIGSSFNWTEPKGTSFEHSANRLNQLREEVYRSMYLQAQGRSMSATPSMQSGRSKEVDMVPSADIMCAMGVQIREAMTKVLEMAALARDDKKLDVSIEGYQFYEEMTTEEVFAAATTLEIRIPSPTFERTLYKKVSDRWTRDQTPQLRSKIHEEIDEGELMEEREEKMMQKQIQATADKMKVKAKQTLAPGRGGSQPSLKTPSTKIK